MYAPYVVYGPPGTGKTKTLVEMIKQACIMKTSKTIKILACAPSNAAADVLARRFGPYMPCNMTLMGAPPHCSIADVFEFPNDLEDVFLLRGSF